VFAVADEAAMTDRVRKVFADVLGISPGVITDETSPDNTSQWDSMAAMSLVVAIEDEFDVRLSTAEIVSMRSIAIVKKVLTAKGVVDT
jgi:acyl carrier protein